MEIEDEVREFDKPKEVDSDLILDPEMLGRFRMEQYLRWMACPRLFMSRDINAMTTEAVMALRRKELLKQKIKDFKEGTDVRRGEDQED